MSSRGLPCRCQLIFAGRMPGLGATMCRTQAVAQIPKHKVEFLCFVKKEHNIIMFESEILSQRRGLPRTNVVSASAQRLYA